MKDVADIKDFALKLRKNILYTSLHAGASSSHFGGSLSTVEIISTLYKNILKINKEDPEWSERDRFILSKGHGCLAYYAALKEMGWLNQDDLKSFEKENTKLLGHPVMNRKLGIEFSNGSLGMGLSIGIGISLAFKKNKKNNKVYVLMGDGECNEGSVWEAAISGPNFNLKNLTTIIDRNNFQQTGSGDEIMSLKDIANKWESFGWNTIEVDGHNIQALQDSFGKDFNNEKPKAIIAHTIKGKGFSFSENNNDWHHKILTQKLYEEGLRELQND
jgi:transketolase